MSELADELARHAQPDRVKALAAEKASEWKGRAKEMVTEKAGELKQHAKEAAVDKATELKTRAKEAVMNRTMEIKEQADTPRGWSLLGAIVGAGVGAVLMKKAFTVRQERYGQTDHAARDEFRYRGESYSTYQRPDIGATPAAGISGDVSAMGGQVGTSMSGGTGTWANTRTDTGIGVGADTGGGLKERASDVAHSVKDRAHDLKDRAQGMVGQVRDRATHLRERIPSGGELKGRTTDWFDRALETQPLMLALGGIALGMFASILVPVTHKERQLIEPAKRKAQEGISQLGDQLGEKLQGNEQSAGSNVGDVGSNIGGMHARREAGAMGSSTAGAMGGSESLMGAERTNLDDEDLTTSSVSPTGSRIPPLPPLDDISTKIH